MSSNDFSVKMTEDTIKSLNKFEIEYELVDGVKGVEGIDIMKAHNIRPSHMLPKGVDSWNYWMSSKSLSFMGSVFKTGSSRS